MTTDGGDLRTEVEELNEMIVKEKDEAESKIDA